MDRGTPREREIGIGTGWDDGCARRWQWQIGDAGNPCYLDNEVSNPAYADIVDELHRKLIEHKNK